MNLHEYQAKNLFASYGIPVPKGKAVAHAQEVEEALEEIGGERWVAKVQVHAGGRGKSGGVKLISSAREASEFAEQFLGRRFVTYQSAPDGQQVGRVLLEQASDIEREFYLGALIDRSSRRVVFLSSVEGGVEIEAVAEKTPEKIVRVTVDPLATAQPYQGRELAFQLGLDGAQAGAFSKIFMGLARLMHEKDLALVEVNPLALTASGELLCVDAKVEIDSNALFRHPDLAELRDVSQEHPGEAKAAQVGLNYVALDGDIGCMVNGAGLAMGTMDMIKLSGGDPANFLDVGGGATSDQVSKAFKLVLADEKVRVVLINIFGGIVRCDLVAEGIIAAINEVGVELPVVVRLEGNNAELGRELLQRAEGVEVIAAASLEQACDQAVQLAKGGSS